MGYDLEIYSETSLKIPIQLDITSHCHTLITGSSGSGKSYALLYLIGMLLKDKPDIIMHFCDFKNAPDFTFMQDYKYYYSGNKCYEGIMEYYQKFTDARENGNVDNRHILIVDEYPAFINYLQMQDKMNKTKYANDILGAVSEVLMLGRGINFGMWIVTQRADSTLFSNGARDNFMNIIALGRMSKEQKTMLFSGQDIPDRIYRRGEGILLADGYAIREVKFPNISDIGNWKQHIIAILEGDSCA
jgi:ABC-type dipeptide/oligopeptide/nickel transport system ATPase component